MSGKSNVILGLISTILISIGSITVSQTMSYPVVGIILVVCGAVGLGIREYLKPDATDVKPPVV